MDFSKFFICPGAQKSGTTWLFRSLRHHPAFKLPTWKEIDYLFYSETSRAKAEKRYQEMVERGRIPAKTREWLEVFLQPWDINIYPHLFDSVEDHFSCDVSPNYSRMTSEEIELAAKVVRGSKIVIILRNPVDRAWSHAIHTIVRDKHPMNRKKLNAKLRAFTVSSRCDLMGEYPRIVRDWRRHFGLENVFVGYFDDLNTDPAGFMDMIMNFVGAPPYPEEFKSSLAESVNTGQRISMPEDLSQELSDRYASQMEELRTMLPAEGMPLWLRA